MSSFLTSLAKAGDQMTLAGPLGSFYLRPIQRPLLLLAGGTGLAPFTAMLEKIAEQGSEHPLHLIYGVTNDFDPSSWTACRPSPRRFTTSPSAPAWPTPTASTHKRVT